MQKYRTVKERMNMRFTNRNVSKRTNFKCTNRNYPKCYRQLTNRKLSFEVRFKQAPIVALHWGTCLKVYQSEKYTTVTPITYFKMSLSVYTVLISEHLTCNIVYDIN